MSFPKRQKPEKSRPKSNAARPSKKAVKGRGAPRVREDSKLGRRGSDSQVEPRNATKNERNATKNERNTSKSERNATKNDRNASKGERNASKSERNTSKSERNASKSGRLERDRPGRNTGRRGASRFAAPRKAESIEVQRPSTPRPEKRAPAPPPPKVIPMSQLSSEPHPGQFLLTTREGAEQDLVDELRLLRIVDPPARVIAPAMVLAPKVPKRDKRPVDLTFARQGFPIVQSVRAHDIDEIAARVGRSLKNQLERAKTYALHVWVPDSTLGNPLASLATELAEKLERILDKALPEANRVDDAALRRLGSIPLAQVCLMDPERAVAGVTYSNAALSLAPGGRTRVRVTGNFPSRAARKLEEALAWLGVEPGPGELCVDLGAAPGGWTYVLAERRARVIAVDPAKLRPEILAKKGVQHVQASAFTYKPDTEADWLFCDMAWRPLEAAALLAKWGRNRWARMLVANIKLPMTKKAEILDRVRHILAEEGDWKHVRTKQLYHDRDEITLTAHVG